MGLCSHRVLVVCAGVIGCCGRVVLDVLRHEQIVSLRWAGLRCYVVVG